jgi:hypothetical protein
VVVRHSICSKGSSEVYARKNTFGSTPGRRVRLTNCVEAEPRKEALRAPATPVGLDSEKGQRMKNDKNSEVTKHEQ